MTLLKKLTLLIAIIGIVATPGAAQARSSSKAADKSVMQFSVTNFLETQAADNVFRLTHSAGKELAALLKTPHVPTKAQLSRQAFQDWFCRLQGSPLRKMTQVGSGVVLLPVTLVAWFLAATTTDYRKPTMSEQASHAAFSIAALAVQTYITERAGFDSSEPLTISDILTIVKDFARKQARPSSDTKDIKTLIKQMLAEERKEQAPEKQMPEDNYNPAETLQDFIN